jgi:hypothetical protein
VNQDAWRRQARHAGWDDGAVDRRQVPVDNVWLPAEVDENTAVGVIASYFDMHADNYEGRALVLAYKDEVDREEDNLALYAANGNVSSRRSKLAKPGGPVLVIPSDLRLLDEGIRLADNQILGVREYKPGSMSGWAAATGALNLATRERHAGVPGEVRQILSDLKWEGNNGYPTPKKGTAYKTMVELHIGKLTALGYTGDFVAGYLVASGLRGDSGENLKKIYGKLSTSPGV